MESLVVNFMQFIHNTIKIGKLLCQITSKYENDVPEQSGNGHRLAGSQ